MRFFVHKLLNLRICVQYYDVIYRRYIETGDR